MLLLNKYFLLDTNGTHILLKVSKGGWFSVLKNIYNNDKELLKQHDVAKSEFYFAINLYTLAHKHPKILELTIPLRKIKSNMGLFKEICYELQL